MTRTHGRRRAGPAANTQTQTPPEAYHQLEGNAFAQEQLRAVQGGAAAQTDEQRFEQAYTAQADRALDPTIPRWRRLSADEAAALPTGEDAPQAGQRGYATTIGDATWQYDVQAHDPAAPARARDLLGPDAAQAYSRAFVTPREGEEGVDDLRILNRDGTVATQSANDEGMVELPTSGFGYQTHNRDDVRVGGRPQPDQWGTPESVARTINTMADYRTLFPNSTLSIGDLSTDTGNSPLLTTGRTTRHASHYQGTQVDLRYPQGEGSSSRPPANDDDMFRFNALMKAGSGWGFDNFHVGPSMRGDGVIFPDGANGHYTRGHDNHLHMGSGTGRRR